MISKNIYRLGRQVQVARLANMQMQMRQFATFQKAVLKPLPYALNGLEPVISEHLMSFHYSKHHQTYVNNLNGLME